MKTWISIILMTISLSCSSNKTITTTPVSPTDNYLQAAFYFDSCEDLRSFLKTIIVTNKEDTTIQQNYFRIPHIKSTYEFTKEIFSEACFMGLSVAELDDIFGERAFLITQGGHVVTSSTGSYSDWYHLESTRIKLALDIYITDNVVKRFRLVPHAVEQMVRGKTN